MQQSQLLEPAEIEWRDGQCFAPRFGDIYASADAEAEVNRVFVEPCGLPELSARFPRLTVGELGFGTGLNFVVTAERLLRYSSARLHFVSVERHPLGVADWCRAMQRYRHRFSLYEELAAQAPPLLAGWHRRTFADGRVVLSVFHGDALEGLTDLAGRQWSSVDAWFLDGFAPDRNPAMWSPEVLSTVARTAHHGTTVSTFSAAGHVRRSLEAVGFAMRRVDQRPHKRESLAGLFAAHTPRRASSAPTAVTVLGGGLGGALVSRDLAIQGSAVTVCDPHGPASGGSSIPAALMHARLLGDGSPTAEYRVSAYHHAAARLHGEHGVTAQAVLQVCGPNLNEAKLRRIAAAYLPANTPSHDWLELLESDTVIERTRGAFNGPGLMFPGAKLIDLPILVHALLDHADIEVRADYAALPDDQPVIVCNGLAALQTLPELSLEVAAVHGQLDRVSAPGGVQSAAVVGNGYFVPGETSCVVGATYEYAPWEHGRATSANLDKNRGLTALTPIPLERHRATRAVTSDRLPLVGHVRDNVWIATGFGSMGTTAAPLAAAEVCSALTGWVRPLSARVREALNPHRFKARQHRRGPARGPGYAARTHGAGT